MATTKRGTTKGRTGMRKSTVKRAGSKVRSAVRRTTTRARRTLR